MISLFSTAIVAVILATVGYVYFGYPALLWLLTRRSGRRIGSVGQTHGPAATGSSFYPSVSLIIAAHNEEAVIARKLANTLMLKYPRDRLEIIVASDGSDDATDEIVFRYAGQGVRLHRLPARRGKLSAIIEAVETARGDILALSDANAMYEPDALEYLVAPFHETEVGCVCGRLLYENPRGTAISDGETLYWTYENRLKAWESRFNSLIGTNGSIYAIRRAAYAPIDPDLSDDYGLPLAIYAKGYRVVYQPLAVSRETAPETPGAEFKKKVRFVAHQLTTLARLWPLLRPFRDARLLFQIVSHKLLRNIIPFLLTLLIPASLMLDAPSGLLLIGGQTVFYGLAATGFLLNRWRVNIKLFAVPMYFCTVNAAAAVGVIQFLRRANYAAWDEERTGMMKGEG